MTRVGFDWNKGVPLNPHSKRKHKILSKYLQQYLVTRCQLPQQEKFRLAVVDGFAGAGRYQKGDPGSPIILLEAVKNTLNEINVQRSNQGMRPLSIECLFIFNDADKDAIEQLKNNISPIIRESNEENDKLFFEIEFYSESFNSLYPKIRRRILDLNFPNVIFNLDQGGYSDVNLNIISNIMYTWGSAEVFLTFMIKALLTYLSPHQQNNRTLVDDPELIDEIYGFLQQNETVINKDSWLGKVEKVIFDRLKNCAPFVSPFSIHNPDGWQYWLIHFANSYRARQVYNDVLHLHSSIQAHFGRSGLRMLAYDPTHEGSLYLFDKNSREKAKEELHDDIPKLISNHGDAMRLSNFYASSYNETPAHSDDIHEMIIRNPDVEVVTPSGGRRRVPNTIRPDDTLKINIQKSFFPMFLTKEPK